MNAMSKCDGCKKETYHMIFHGVLPNQKWGAIKVCSVCGKKVELKGGRP